MKSNYDVTDHQYIDTDPSEDALDHCDTEMHHSDQSEDDSEYQCEDQSGDVVQVRDCTFNRQHGSVGRSAGFRYVDVESYKLYVDDSQNLVKGINYFYG